MPDEQIKRLNTRGLDVDRLAKVAFDGLSFRTDLGPDINAASYSRATGWATLALLAEVQKLRSAVESLNQVLPREINELIKRMPT